MTRVIESTKCLGFTTAAWVLALTSTLISFLAMVFVIAYRGNKIVTVGQPFFLCMICFGALLISISLYFDAGSIEEIPGITWTVLDRLCILQQWCMYTGTLTVLLGLFCKLWRAEQVCQFRKGKKVLVKHVIWPFVAIIALEFILLIAATSICPPKWGEIAMTPFADGKNPFAMDSTNSTSTSTNTNTNTTGMELRVDNIFLRDVDMDSENSTNSIGMEEILTLEDDMDSAKSDMMPKCLVQPLPIQVAQQAISQGLIVMCRVVVIWMAYQTRNIPEDLVDTKRVYYLMVCHIALYIPYLLLKYGVIPSGMFYHYFEIVFPFLMSVTSVGFLVFPKVYCVFYQKKYGRLPNSVRSTFTGGSKVHISGTISATKALQAAAVQVGPSMASSTKRTSDEPSYALDGQWDEHRLSVSERTDGRMSFSDRTDGRKSIL